MPKCRACGKFLSPVGATAVTCACSAIYHKACVAIPEDSQMPVDWMCPECKCKLPKKGNAATPVKGISHGDIMHPSSEKTTISVDIITAVDDIASQSPAPATTFTPVHSNLPDTAHSLALSPSVELGLEIRLFREELREVREEFKGLRQEISDLRSVLTRSNDRIDVLEKRINALEGLKETNSSSKVSALEQMIVKLKIDINDREQEMLQSDLEVSNLPEIAGENPTQTVMVLASKLGLTLKQEDIVFAERVGKTFEVSKGETKKGRRLVVRLSRRQLRDDFIQSARVRRGATSVDLGLDQSPRRFYVNERLTPINKKLFFSTREVAKRLLWKYTWTKRGRIYARQVEGKPVHTIRTEEDLERVFGSSEVRNAGENQS